MIKDYYSVKEFHFQEYKNEYHLRTKAETQFAYVTAEERIKEMGNYCDNFHSHLFTTTSTISN